MDLADGAAAWSGRVRAHLCVRDQGGGAGGEEGGAEQGQEVLGLCTVEGKRYICMYTSMDMYTTHI